MKTDLDQLMEEASLDALLVGGPAMHNPSMAYFMGLHHISSGYLLKARGSDPIHFHNPMERDEAAANGVKTLSMYDFGQWDFYEQSGGDAIHADAMMLERILTEFGIKGRVAIYGQGEIGTSWSILRILGERMPLIELVGENQHNSILMQARVTKDDDEIERIRAMGKVTVAVVSDVASFLTSHEVVDGFLVDRSGQRLTAGTVKQKINLWLAMRGAENPQGTIFAIGRDGGIPHSAGSDGDPIPVGQPIVFDIFPCEAGGGYFFDFTRTWCLGYADEAVIELHSQVLEVYETIYRALEAGTPARQYQVQACELFEAMGHPTVLSDRKTQIGYPHSLAHGLGLDVHEAPSFSIIESNTNQLQPGTVFTLEPGLYYPERGMGVRIEDTVCIGSDGQVETLVEYPKDLILKMPAQ